MSKIFTNQISTTSGTTFNLPKVDGSANSMLATDGSGNLKFINQTSLNVVDTLTPADSTNIWGSVITQSARANDYGYSGFTSSGPWTTYYHSRSAGSNGTSTTQGWNMFLGDGYPNNESMQTYAGNYTGCRQRQQLFANNYRVGWVREMDYEANSTGDYSGCTWQVIPVRNPTSSSITSTMYWALTSYNSTYGGACLGVFTPGAATYSGASGGTFSQLYGSESSTKTSTSQPLTVPANTTVLVMGNSSHYYSTTYQFQDWNLFYNLHVLSSAGLVCDMRMLKSLEMGRSQSNGYTAYYPHQLYNACASIFGDR
jgi:hypothetical protein